VTYRTIRFKKTILTFFGWRLYGITRLVKDEMGRDYWRPVWWRYKI